MPKKRHNQSGRGSARSQLPAPVLKAVNPGPSSAARLADTSQPKTTPATASGHEPSISNNANSNALSGVGNIINGNPIWNLQHSSGATVNYAPVNNAPITNLMLAGEGGPDYADGHQRIINFIVTIIGDRFVSDAFFDAQPKHVGCMLGTREFVIARIYKWSSQGKTHIFWLAGMAGTGKTSVAVTFCRMLFRDDSDMKLGGSFFCSRSAGSIDRTEVRNILPTLVATLATQYLEFSIALAAALKADPRAARKPVSEQLKILLVNTFEKIKPSTMPIIFLIDGLDECTNEREVAELLVAIADLKINTNVKFIIVSRPEMHIRGTPISHPNHNTILQLHTLKESEITIDIWRYVTGTLEAAATASATAWYKNDDVKTLVRLSNGLFIFASTVLMYILDKEQDSGRRERLHKVIHTATYGSAATASLDRIYEMIVLGAARSDKVDADELRATQRVLATIIAARSPLSVLALAELLDTDATNVRGSLERLHSVVYMPADDEAPGVRALHASFGDYVVSRAADRVRIPATLGDQVLACGCLNVISKRLHFNVSQSSSSYQPNPDTKPETFTLALEYACLEWIYHIAGVEDPSAWDEEINSKFRLRFLFWLEVMSVLGKVQRASAMLVAAAATVKSNQLLQFLRDAQAFVTSSSEAIKHSAPHIYLSALPFAPTNSLIFQEFAPVCTGLPSVEVFGIEQHGSRLVMTLMGHSGSVTSVDCSSDGRLVVSGSSDGTVRVWDIHTGEEAIPPLDCDGGFIHSVAFAPNGKKISASTEMGGLLTWSIAATHATLQWQYPSTISTRSVTFSPDSSLVASGFSDGVVRLWRADTSAILTTLRCHYEVKTVAFSPDGKTIASMSGSTGTIQLWRVATSKPLGGPLGRRILSPCGMCFSPDGTTLAMLGQRGSVELRKVKDWEIIATIRQGSEKINHIQFSPDGQSIVLASDDGCVYLSPISVEGTESPPVVFRGHTDGVRSATVSHDGRYIVSGSYDCIIRVWDAVGSLKAVQTISPHSDRISSITTASDGTLIVSGSHDHSVRVWNARTGAPRLAPLLGHTDAVLSVVISQDGRVIASASADATVRLWNSRDGRAIGNPLRGHEDGVNSVAISPDTLWLLSGSDDLTARIWDIATQRQAGPGSWHCSGRVRTVAFSPNGRLIAAGDQTGHIHLWHPDTGEALFHASLKAMNESVCSIGFSPRSGRIVVVGHMGSVTAWNVETGAELLSHTSISDGEKSVALSHDGRLICSGSSVEKVVSIRNVTTGKDVLMLAGHTTGVNSLALKPDGSSLITSSSDQIIRVWDLGTARSRPSGSQNDPTEPLASATLKNGWLVSSSGNRLLWVPLEYRKHLPIWPCTMLIAEECINITIGNDGWHRGSFWTSCWLDDA